MSSRPAKSKEVLVRSVSLIWYPLALIPIVGLFFAAIFGYVPAMLAPMATFLLFFWIFSFGFAVYGKLRKPPKDLRQ